MLGSRPVIRCGRCATSAASSGACRPCSKYLSQHPEKGFLGYQQLGIGTANVQYWRSFADLERFARDEDDPHLAPWRAYWKRVGRSDRTGIWHETYLVRAGEYEAIYGNMPPFGLGKATELVPLSPTPRPRRLRRRDRLTQGRGLTGQSVPVGELRRAPRGRAASDFSAYAIICSSPCGAEPVGHAVDGLRDRGVDVGGADVLRLFGGVGGGVDRVRAAHGAIQTQRDGARGRALSP